MREHFLWSIGVAIISGLDGWNTSAMVWSCWWCWHPLLLLVCAGCQYCPSVFVFLCVPWCVCRHSNCQRGESIYIYIYKMRTHTRTHEHTPYKWQYLPQNDAWPGIDCRCEISWYWECVQTADSTDIMYTVKVIEPWSCSVLELTVLK